MPSVWQEMDAQRQSCHSWRDVAGHTFPAMSLLLALAILLVAIAVLATAVILVVRRDGYGTAEPPRSHAAWDDATTLSRSRGA